MRRLSLLISRYLLGAVVPYFLFSWALLTVILFLQQASRYADLFFNVNLQGDLVWQLMIGLVPNVVAFTCPMAVLVGTVIGLSKMQGDSELAAIRAAGVGNAQIALPIAILGILLSIFAFAVNLKGVPFAAALVRRVAMQSAVAKFESPIEPGVFYSEIEGFTIYARDADPAAGRLQNVFISQKDDANGVFRFVTSDIGRMDIDGEATELVLENASVVTVPITAGEKKYAFETIKDVRVALKTKRAEMLERLSKVVKLPDELGLAELRDYAAAADGKERIEAQIIFQRRIVMSVTPLVFCLLGTVMVLRFKRGGRGFGIFLALIGLVGYYLFSFAGEQLARSGRVNVIVASFLPLFVSAIAMFWLAYSPRLEIGDSIASFVGNALARFRTRPQGLSQANKLVDITSGLRDLDLGTTLARYFLITSGFLLAVFLIFTAFETWRFASAVEGGGSLLAQYLLYLLPFAYLQIAPSAAMIAALATYAIKSRNNELVTWAAAGQSAYRLLLPCVLLALTLGIADFGIQELLAPRANRIQDELRSRLKGGGLFPVGGSRRWSMDGNFVFSFEAVKADTGSSSSAFGGDLPSGTPASDNEIARRYASPDEGPTNAVASDNEIEKPYVRGRGTDRLGVHRERRDLAVLARFESDQENRASSRDFGGSGIGPLLFVAPGFAFINSASDNEKARTCSPCVKNVFVLEFSDDKRRLQAVYRADFGQFEDGRAELTGNVERISSLSGDVSIEKVGDRELAVDADPFREKASKPNHLGLRELSRSAAMSASENERRNYSVSIQRRLAALFLPLVIILFAAPWAISLRPGSMVSSLSAAVGIWLVFIAVVNLFEQYGLNGSLGVVVAVWAPLAVFAFLGVFLVSRVRS